MSVRQSRTRGNSPGKKHALSLPLDNPQGPQLNYIPEPAGDADKQFRLVMDLRMRLMTGLTQRLLSSALASASASELVRF